MPDVISADGLWRGMTVVLARANATRAAIISAPAATRKTAPATTCGPMTVGTAIRYVTTSASRVQNGNADVGTGQRGNRAREME